MFKKTDTSIKTKLVDSKTKKEIVFDVFPKRSFKKFDSWYEGHAQGSLKTIFYNSATRIKRK